MNLVVVAGSIFTALVSFELARMIQRRNFPRYQRLSHAGTHRPVTTAISYAVEIAGMRIQLWSWRAAHPVAWLPFDWPFGRFEAGPPRPS